MKRFVVNNAAIELDLSSDEVLLDIIRKHLNLTGVKEGCREGDCGACTVLMGELRGEDVIYRAVNSCLLPLGDVDGRHVVTIEGLNGPTLNPLQDIIVERGATQCGFCTPGIIMSLTGFLLNADRLDVDRAVTYLDGNICRCTGYGSIRRAVETLCSSLDHEEFMNSRAGAERTSLLVKKDMIPDYFLSVADMLKDMRGVDDSHRPPHRSTVVAGGTDLFVQKAGLLTGDDLSFISGRDDLKGIVEEDGSVVIGAATTMEGIRRSSVMKNYFPHIEEYFSLIASMPIRGRATVGGNIINASPIGDLSVMLLALSATINLSDGRANRDVPLKDFFKGYKVLDLNDDEMAVHVRFVPPEEDALFNFEKVACRTHLDIASVNTAIMLQVDDGTIENVHISAGGVAPTPLHLTATGAYLVGREVCPEELAKAIEIAQQEISPISDVRGTAEYKRILLRQLIYAHFIKLVPQLIEGGAR